MKIKFRAWDKSQNKMLSVNLISFGEKCFNCPDEKWGLWHNYSKRGDCELMQYTGLKDKNGKEIYEGDIVNWTTEDVNDVVRFKDGTFMIGDVCSFNVSVSNLEVIGNIYENPDLLK